MRTVRTLLAILLALSVSGCADPLDDPEGILPAVLDADVVCSNTSIVLSVDEGSDYWMTEDTRPAEWAGDISGTFRWVGLEGRFVAADGTAMDYFRLGEGQFSAHGCAI